MTYLYYSEDQDGFFDLNRVEFAKFETLEGLVALHLYFSNAKNIITLFGDEAKIMKGILYSKSISIKGVGNREAR